MKKNLLFVIGIFALLFLMGCSKDDDKKYKDINATVGGFMPRWEGNEITVTDSGDKLMIITDCFRGRALKFKVPKTLGTYYHGEDGVQLICILNRIDPIECYPPYNMDECPGTNGIFEITESTGQNIKGSFNFYVVHPRGGPVDIDGTFEIDY